MVGGRPWASSTRILPFSTRRIRHELFPSCTMSPAVLSMAKSSFSVPMKVSVGSMITS